MRLRVRVHVSVCVCRTGGGACVGASVERVRKRICVGVHACQHVCMCARARAWSGADGVRACVQLRTTNTEQAGGVNYFIYTRGGNCTESFDLLSSSLETFGVPFQRTDDGQALRLEPPLVNAAPVYNISNLASGSPTGKRNWPRHVMCKAMLKGRMLQSSLSIPSP